MADVLPLDRALAKHRKAIKDKKDKLDKIAQEALNLANREPDGFRRFVYDRLSQYAKVMDDLFSNVEIMSTYSASLQVKIEGLRDIVYELEEVKRNPVIQEKIRSLFLDYQYRF